MKNTIVFILLFSSCLYSQSIKSYSYKEQTIPQFFKKLIENHQTDFYKIDSSSYQYLCNSFDLNPKDSNNIKTYFTLSILHDLFTSKNASNGSRGEILNIPYYWHWLKPNPRHSIYDTKTKKLLKECKPPKEYGKYNSAADIDRTPYLYLSDLFTEYPKYNSSLCDTFSTFGWCSEREMAFVNLAEILGFEGKIVAEGNHCWSEIWLNMNAVSGLKKCFQVRIDNTFDGFSWKYSDIIEKKEWKAYLGKLSMTNWYNKMAHSESERLKIKAHMANPRATMRIEKAVVEYFGK